MKESQMLECEPSSWGQGFYNLPRWHAQYMSLKLFARHWTIAPGSSLAWSWSFNKFLNRILNRSKWKVMIFKYFSASSYATLEFINTNDITGNFATSVPVEINNEPTPGRTGPWFRHLGCGISVPVHFVLTDFVFIEVLSWSKFEQRDLQIVITTNDEVYQSRELSCRNCIKLFSTEQSTIFALPWTHEKCPAEDVVDYIRSTFNWFKGKDKNTWTDDMPFNILLNEKNTTFSVSLSLPLPGNLPFVLANLEQRYN